MQFVSSISAGVLGKPSAAIVSQLTMLLRSIVQRALGAVRSRETSPFSPVFSFLDRSRLGAR